MGVEHRLIRASVLWKRKGALTKVELKQASGSLPIKAGGLNGMRRVDEYITYDVGRRTEASRGGEAIP